MNRWLCLLFLCVWHLQAGAATAHELRPALVEMRETSSGRFEVVFKRPAQGNLALALAISLRPDCKETSPRVQFLVGGSAIRRWTIDCGQEGLSGRRLTIVGLEKTLTDTLVLVVYASGGKESAILRPSNPGLTFKGPVGWADVVLDYTLLGVEHILGGLDHLLFVLCLIFLVRGVGALVKTVTAFTIAHSMTLGAATLGFVNVPPGPVEALIALSIVLLAAEIALQGRRGVAARRPWIIAFAFGLLHGFGFAGALSNVGLPEADIPLALLAFNVGVEIGQLVFVAVALAFIAALRAISSSDFRWDGQWATPRIATIYAVGGVSSYWLIDRVAGIVA